MATKAPLRRGTTCLEEFQEVSKTNMATQSQDSPTVEGETLTHGYDDNQQVHKGTYRNLYSVAHSNSESESFRVQKPIPSCDVVSKNSSPGESTAAKNDTDGLTETASKTIIPSSISEITSVTQGEDLRRLTQAFEGLGIEFRPKPYSRDAPSNARSNGYVEPLYQQRELPLTLSPEKHPILSEEGTNVIYCKNLFLKDRRGQFYIVVCLEDDSVDLKVLKQKLCAHRNLSFADNEALQRVLHLAPGAVTPLAVFHESAKDVRVAVHGQLAKIGTNKSSVRFAFHPLCGHLQVELSYPELVAFVEHFGKTVEVISYDSEDSLPLQGASDRERQRKQNHDISALPLLTSEKPDPVEAISENVKTSLKEAEEPNTKVPHKPQGKRFFISRKGKLASYMRKNGKTDSTESAANIVSGGNSTSDNSENGASERRGSISADAISRTDWPECEAGLNLERLSEEGQACEKDGTRSGNDDVCLKSQLQRSKVSPNRLESIHQTNLLPEVSQFYSSLSDSGVEYREIDLSGEGSEGTPIGPSIGCRCFLLRDKRDNFFFLISHELYELDFGRLKATLKPRKKLMVADPADVISVLGTDPARMTPFATLTLRGQKPQVYFTQKVMAPSLVFCIQHPFAQASRILMKSADLQKFLTHLGLTFGVVEERHWPTRHNFPFAQFENRYTRSSDGMVQKDIPTTIDQHSDNFVKSDLNVDNIENTENTGLVTVGESEVKPAVRGTHNLPLTQQGSLSTQRFPCSLAGPFQRFAEYVFPFRGFLQRSAGSLHSRYSNCSEGSPVDAPAFGSLRNKKAENSSPQTALQLQASNSHREMSKVERISDGLENNKRNENQRPDLSDTRGPTCKANSFDPVSFPISSKDIERHLLSLNITFKLTKKRPIETEVKNDDDHDNENYSNDDNDDDDDDSTIIERCSAMHITNREGHNYVIIGAHDDFPVSIMRFRRRSQLPLREHLLDIRFDPSRDENSTLELPFALASVSFRAAIWAGFRSECSTGNSNNQYQYHPGGRHTLPMSSAEPMEAPEVTIAMTTTLYIDPETIMEFVVGPERSRLRMTSSEFEKYARAVGFEVWYF